MENEQKKSDNHNRIYIIIAALVLCAGAYCALRSSGNGAGTAEVHQRTDAAMDAIEREHAVTGCELDTAGAELDSATATLGRVDQLITASQERVNQNAASIDECQRIVGECRKIVADCNRIYCEVEEANRSGTGSCGGS